MDQLQSLIQIHAECIRKIYLHEWLKFMENVIYIPYIRRIWVIMNYEYGLLRRNTVDKATICWAWCVS